MTTSLQFERVKQDQIDSLSFSIESGEVGILQMPSTAQKMAVINLALRELLPFAGEIRLGEHPLGLARVNSIAWIAANGGLLSNLKVWENITLPLWYHNGRKLVDTEESVLFWLSTMNLPPTKYEEFMASPVARLIPWERKLAGLLRGIIQDPEVLIVDANIFDDINEINRDTLIQVIEKFSHAAEDHSVLVVTTKETRLPWKIIEHT